MAINRLDKLKKKIYVLKGCNTRICYFGLPDGKYSKTTQQKIGFCNKIKIKTPIKNVEIENLCWKM